MTRRLLLCLSLFMLLGQAHMLRLEVQQLAHRAGELELKVATAQERADAALDLAARAQVEAERALAELDAWDGGPRGGPGIRYDTMSTIKEALIAVSAVTPTALRLSSGVAHASYRCVNLGTTPVYFGSVAVTTATGTPVCTDPAACPDGAGAGADAKLEYALSSSGTVTLRCRFGVQ